MEKPKKKVIVCLKCDAHETIADPDPGDWFRDGDMAVICKIAKNPDFDKNAKYQADRQEFRVVAGGLGPWDWDDITVPKWCPKKKKLAKKKAKGKKK
jgi:hypothetical protein